MTRKHLEFETVEYAEGIVVSDCDWREGTKSVAERFINEQVSRSIGWDVEVPITWRRSLEQGEMVGEAVGSVVVPARKWRFKRLAWTLRADGSGYERDTTTQIGTLTEPNLRTIQHRLGW